MKEKPPFHNLAIFALGALVGGVFLWQWKQPVTVIAQAQVQPSADLVAMQADIAHLKEVIPSQSHTMTDVGFQFANLWFAGQKKNWPLADFYLNEARQHIQWTIRIRPVRKDPAGNPVDLNPIFDAINGGILTKLKQAIEGQDSAHFEAAYKQTLQGCYSCHQASGKPYLHPVVPTDPPQTIIKFDPDPAP
jgi:hypothetical protein